MVPSQIEKVVKLEELVEEFKLKEENLLQEVDRLKKCLDEKENTHELHLRAYQDGHDRQKEQLNLFEKRVYIFNYLAGLHD